jgi:hypothetical protein
MHAPHGWGRRQLEERPEATRWLDRLLFVLPGWWLILLFGRWLGWWLGWFLDWLLGGGLGRPGDVTPWALADQAPTHGTTP